MNANLIVVGGPVSVGKSSLVEKMGLPQVQELDDNDVIQDLILESTYKKDRISPEVIEYYFLTKRKINYMKYSRTMQTHLLDRSIFESLWFAKENMSQKSFTHFKILWKNEIRDLLNEFGKPKLYILLTASWETFKERFFMRAREVEVKNFQSNESFFRKHIKEYKDHMIEIFKEWDLNYVVINTDGLNKEEVLEIARKEVSNV